MLDAAHKPALVKFFSVSYFASPLFHKVMLVFLFLYANNVAKDCK